MLQELWNDEKQKLIKSGRKWKPSETYMPYRYAELFCEKCGESMGLHDIVTTNLETLMYCTDCVTPYIKSTPYKLTDEINITFDNGNIVTAEYLNGYYEKLAVDKVCYFNKKGRYIKVKGKRIYINFLKGSDIY